MQSDSRKDNRPDFNGEMVLTVPDKTLSCRLSTVDHFNQGCIDLIDLIKPEMRFVDRALAETDITLRQIISYILIRRYILNEPQFYLFKRLGTQGEKRLHNLYSLGAGGHINPVDTSSDDPLDAGLKRELEEELYLPEKYSLQFEGWIYSDIDPVSCVHVGLVYVMDVLKGEVEIREKDKMTGEWCDMEKLISLRDSMEGWSRIVLNDLIFP
jgi:predicted NUDIX family phosphoesterase